MILTITPNPAIDRNLIVRNHGGGGTLRPQETLVLAGGKGVNVARAIRNLGGDALCAGFLCGHSGRYIEEQLAEQGYNSAWTHLKHGESRSCIILIDPQNNYTTVINENGPNLTANDWKYLQSDLKKAAQNLKSICFCGSVPPTDDMSHYSDTIQQLLDAGKSVWVDTSRAALKQAFTVQGVNLKVNHEEASVLLDDMPISTPTEAQAAAQKIHAQTSSAAIITLGEAGVAYVDANEAWYAKPPSIKVESAVGSGDSFFAGLLIALEKGEGVADALKLGVAAGAANAQSIGSAVFKEAEVQSLLPQVSIESLK